MRITTVSSGFTTTQALISGVAAPAPPPPCALRSPANGMWKPTTSVPAAAADVPRKRRRDEIGRHVVLPSLC